MITLDSIFQNGMVLQQKCPVQIWGSATEDCRITVTADHEILCETDVSAGKFSCLLKAQEAKESVTLTVASTDGTVITLTDIAFGEVWIAGGQSNMELTMSMDREFKRMKRQFRDTGLRFYEVPKLGCDIPSEDPKLKKQGIWYACDFETLELCSAVGFYFGCKLRQELKVPVAIISCNYGGSPAYAWMAEETLANHPVLHKYWDAHQNYLSEYPEEADRENFLKLRKSQASSAYQQVTKLYMKGRIPKFLRENMWKKRNGQPAVNTGIGRFHPWRPCGLYKHMLSKIIGYTASGVIWYQGESDAASRSADYGELMKAVITQWRQDWQSELPFFMVELAPFDHDIFEWGKEYPAIRLQQQMLAAKMEGVYSVSIMDVGQPYNIHPNEKQPVGERLARAALANVYGKDIPWKYPIPTAATWEKDHVVLTYPIPLKLSDGKTPVEFEAVNKSGTIAINKVSIQGNQIHLYTMNRPEVVRYAQTGYCKINLYDETGLAAGPFIMNIQ